MGVFTPARRKTTFLALFCLVVLGASSFLLARTVASAAGAYTTVQPGTFAGSAFDACTAPSSAAMKAWKSSPYKAVGIYFGGNNRGCTQANLTPAWVKEQVTAGWKLLPLYVGPQASCTSATKKKNLIDNAKAGAMGQAAADDAAAQAGKLGLARQSILIYDMEAYSTTDAVCRKGVLAFMHGWTSQLHYLGYLSGFYSSVSSGVADQVANYAVPSYAEPDYVDFARWDQKVVLTDANVPATVWAGHRRMKQYRGGHVETWGGVAINVDNNYVDFAPPPAAKMADFNGNGWSDVLARTASTGNFFVYPGNGTTLSEGSRKNIGPGWNTMNAIVRVGDLDKDGHEDVVARQTNGDLWFYPGNGSVLGKRKKLATKWGGYREITAAGDFNRDGYPDLIAVKGAKLYLFPGKSGSKIGARKQIGTGWSGFAELAGIGDLDKDGNPDLVARQTSNGTLYLYPGRKTTLGTRKSLGGGWNGFRDLVGVGDFDRDGTVDLLAVRKSDNGLMLYRGGAGAFRQFAKIGSFAGRTPLA